MRKKVILVTGAAGEIGLALIQNLAQDNRLAIVSLDLQALPEKVSGASTHIQGDILDHSLLSRLVSEYEIDTIYHLAALLSTRAEFTPEAAHRVNVEGTLVLLQLAAEQSEWRGEPVKFYFPQLDRGVWHARPGDQDCTTTVCANGNGITHAQCTAATNCTASSWALTSASITASWRPTVR